MTYVSSVTWKFQIGPDFKGFYPWVGENYVASRHRILVLGESHYRGDQMEVEPDAGEQMFTIEQTQRALGQGAHLFWTKLGVLLPRVFKPLIGAAWEEVAFYNFCTAFVAGGARIRPTKRNFQLSPPSLERVLRVLGPKYVLVCGFRLWDNLYDFCGLKTHLEGPPTSEYWAYGSLPAVPTSGFVLMRHPSSAFAYEREERRLVSARQAWLNK